MPSVCCPVPWGDSSRVSLIIGIFSLTALFTSVPVPGDIEGIFRLAALAAALALAWSRFCARTSISSLACLVASVCLLWASDGPAGVDLGIWVALCPIGSLSFPGAAASSRGRRLLSWPVYWCLPQGISFSLHYCSYPPWWSIIHTRSLMVMVAPSA